MQKEEQQTKDPVSIEILSLKGNELILGIEYSLSRNTVINPRTTKPNSTKEIWKSMKISMVRQINISGIKDKASTIEELKEVIKETVQIERDAINSYMPSPKPL